MFLANSTAFSISDFASVSLLLRANMAFVLASFKSAISLSLSATRDSSGARAIFIAAPSKANSTLLSCDLSCSNSLRDLGAETSIW